MAVDVGVEAELGRATFTGTLWTPRCTLAEEYYCIIDHLEKMALHSSI